MGTKQMRRIQKWGYIFIAPGLVWFFLFMLLPMIEVIRLSFVMYRGSEPNVFVGLYNYKSILTSKDFGAAFLHTFVFVGIVLVGVLPLSLVLAFLLSTIKSGSGFFRALYYLPSVVGIVSIGIVWQWVFVPKFGLMDNLFTRLGWNPINWLNDGTMAVISVSIVKIWMRLGFSVILFLAGILNIPKELYEAAKVDGVPSVKQFFYITIPMVMPIMTLLVILTTIDTLQMFGEIFMLTKGGPAGRTTTVGYLMYNTAFRYMEMGKASAMGLILLVVIMALTLIQQKYLDSKTTTV